MTKQKFLTYNGVDVYLDSDGTFLAEVDGPLIRSATFEGVKREIEMERKATAKTLKLSLPCFAVITAGHNDDECYSIEKVTLVGLNRSDSSFKFAEHVEGKLSFALPVSEDNLAFLTEYVAAKNAVNRIEVEIHDAKLHPGFYGGRIQASEYARHLEVLQSRYEQAVTAMEGKKGARGKKP